LPCEDRQHRKINCTLQNALAEKGAENLQCHNAIRGMPLRSATQHNAMQRQQLGFATKVTFAPKVFTLHISKR